MDSLEGYPRITISGARGIVGEDFTVDNVQRMAWAYACFIGGGRVILARDSRSSGLMFKHAVVSGLLAGGADAIDIGLCPTPTVGIMIRTFHANGGINLTASHNPSPWNAVKFISGDGTLPGESFIREYIDYLHRGEFKHARWDEIGSVQTDDTALSIHCDWVEKAVDGSAIRDRGFRVVVDGCRSAGGVFLPRLLERLGCEVIPLDCEPDGLFSRELEPIPQNLTALCQHVRENRADIGIAADPDADRLAIVSEKGDAIGEEYTLAFAVLAALKKSKGGKAVTNLSTSMLTDYAAKQAGGTVIRTPIGEAHVAQSITENNAAIGGEGNGGVMYPAVHNGRDSMTAAALVLSLMAETGVSVSELVAQFPDYVILKDKVEIDLKDAHTRLERIAGMPHKGEVDVRDGVKILFPDAWLHLRCSNTEPIVRIIAEARGESEARRLLEEGIGLLQTG